MAEQKKTTRKSGTGTTKAPAKSTAVKKNTNGKSSSGKSSSPKSQHKGNAKVIENDSRFGDSILDEVILIIIMLISLVAEISVLTEKMGVIGHLFSSLFKGLFGFAGVLLPLCIIIYCGWLLASEERKMPVVRGLGGLLFLLCVAAGVHLIHPIEATANLKFFQKVALYYGEGAMGNGGLLGGALGGLLYGAFDTLGSTLVLIALLIISLIMTTGKSFFQAVSDYSAHQKAMQKVRYEKIKSRAEQIRLMEQAEAEKRERRRQREKKKGSYNIELRDQEGCEVEAPDIVETVFRKKDPVKYKKADPIYNFIFEEGQEGAPDEEIEDFEIESVGENQKKDEEIPIMIHSKAVQDEGEEMIEEIFRETPEEEILLSEEEDVFSKDEPLGDTEEIPIVVLDEETESLIASDNLDMSESINISDDLEMTADADDLEDTEKGKKQEKTAEETEAVPEEEVPAEPIEEEMPYVFPPIELLGEDPKSGGGDSKAEMLANAKKLESTLKSFGVDAKVIQINRGPTVTRYELSPSQGVKVSKIVNLADDIALNLAASGIRIEAPIPGKAAVGIEVPNRETQSVYLRTVLDSDAFHNHGSKLAFALGEDIAGNPVVTDIGKMPHLLIAGATGSGKSVCINTLITSILYKADPKDVKLLLVDPKVVELSVYNGIPHLLIPVVTDPKKASAALNWAVREMLQRYNDFASFGVRDIKGFNAMKEEEGDEKGKMAQIVIVIDELADLMMAAPGEVEDSICRLAQMARAAGMHLIIATQRPSVDVITGVIKANIPSRLAFAVSSGIDSRTILDMVGAEKLLGKGDMLFYPAGQSKPARLQGAFVTDKEVEDIVSFLKKSGRPGYTQDTIDQITKVTKTGMDADEDSDEFFEPAVDLIIEKEKASVSMLQRQFRIGYNRAARLMDELERKGMVGPEDGSKPRKVLITRAQWETIKEPVEEEL
ncbi:MAG: DNA translocase FtsK [Anaerotignum propionicum]|uniref:DNA translocase FtsK n=1 Tax=Anaerotignum propionicum TaxID=28446 RepID=UPI002B1F5AED|nr:DNA translocase FtsK [Anaerotignum propionicum]MEA5058154.1 DNA translocase FtsK [Anaerotignum propionicum]